MVINQAYSQGIENEFDDVLKLLSRLQEEDRGKYRGGSCSVFLQYEVNMQRR